ncbi:uncharacterized protein [Watersipora subatra]|uniref:uncharacterized protein isoform X2 n=1 Tax=Watersipora subatra TaxID=2589382 RepID=UPI00355BDB9D
MELYNYSIVKGRRGKQRLEGRIGGPDGPLWKTTCLKRMKDGYALTSCNKLYRLMTQSASQNLTPSSDSDTSQFLPEAPEHATSDLAERYSQAKEHHRQLAIKLNESQQELEELESQMALNYHDKETALDITTQVTRPISVESWLERSSIGSHQGTSPRQSPRDIGHYLRSPVNYTPYDATFEVDDARDEHSPVSRPSVPHQNSHTTRLPQSLTKIKFKSPRAVVSDYYGDPLMSLPAFSKKESTHDSTTPTKKRKTRKEPLKEEMWTLRGPKDHCELDVEWRNNELKRFDQAVGHLPAEQFTCDYDYWMAVSKRVKTKSQRQCSELFQQVKKNRSLREREERAARRSSNRSAAGNFTRLSHEKLSSQPRLSERKEIRKVTEIFDSPGQKEATSPVQHNKSTPLRLAGKKTLRRKQQLENLVDKMNEGYSPDVFDSCMPNVKKYKLPGVELTPFHVVSRNTPSLDQRRQAHTDDAEEVFSKDDLRRQRKGTYRFVKALPMKQVWPVNKKVRREDSPRSHIESRSPRRPARPQVVINETFLQQDYDVSDASYISLSDSNHEYSPAY